MLKKKKKIPNLLKKKNMPRKKNVNKKIMSN